MVVRRRHRGCPLIGLIQLHITADNRRMSYEASRLRHGLPAPRWRTGGIPASDSAASGTEFRDDAKGPTHRPLFGFALTG
jgi:hypothetical protein